MVTTVITATLWNTPLKVIEGGANKSVMLSYSDVDLRKEKSSCISLFLSLDMAKRLLYDLGVAIQDMERTRCSKCGRKLKEEEQETGRCEKCYQKQLQERIEERKHPDTKRGYV